MSHYWTIGMSSQCISLGLPSRSAGPLTRSRHATTFLKNTFSTILESKKVCDSAHMLVNKDEMRKNCMIWKRKVFLILQQFTCFLPHILSRSHSRLRSSNLPRTMTALVPSSARGQIRSMLRWAPSPPMASNLLVLKFKSNYRTIASTVVKQLL